MNGGWPYCTGQVGDDLTAADIGGAYVDWDFATASPRPLPGRQSPALRRATTRSR